MAIDNSAITPQQGTRAAVKREYSGCSAKLCCCTPGQQVDQLTRQQRHTCLGRRCVALMRLHDVDANTRVPQVLGQAGRHQEALLALQGVLAAAPGTPGLLPRLQAAAALAVRCQRRGATPQVQVFIAAKTLLWFAAAFKFAAARRCELVMSLRDAVWLLWFAGCRHGTEQRRLRCPLHRTGRRPRRGAQRVQAAGGTVAPRQVGGGSTGGAGGCSGAVSGGAACIRGPGRQMTLEHMVPAFCGSWTSLLIGLLGA